MNSRPLFVGVGLVVCVVALAMAGKQRQQLSALRAEQQRLAAESEPAEQAEQLVARNPAPAALQAGPPLELLELRSEVTRLKGRQRELAGARGENEQLRAQLAVKGTNSLAVPTLLPGYILKSKAQWKGFNSPEDTLQSFLWAAQHRDLTNLLQTVTPEMAQQVLAESRKAGGSTDDFFKSLEGVPGMRIVERTPSPDGSVILKVEILPGLAKMETIRLRQINSQWKMDMR